MAESRLKEVKNEPDLYNLNSILEESARAIATVIDKISNNMNLKLSLDEQLEIDSPIMRILKSLGVACQRYVDDVAFDSEEIKEMMKKVTAVESMGNNLTSSIKEFYKESLSAPLELAPAIQKKRVEFFEQFLRLISHFRQIKFVPNRRSLMVEAQPVSTSESPVAAESKVLPTSSAAKRTTQILSQLRFEEAWQEALQSTPTPTQPLTQTLNPSRFNFSPPVPRASDAAVRATQFEKQFQHAVSAIYTPDKH